MSEKQTYTNYLLTIPEDVAREVWKNVYNEVVKDINPSYRNFAKQRGMKRYWQRGINNEIYSRHWNMCYGKMVSLMREAVRNQCSDESMAKLRVYESECKELYGDEIVIDYKFMEHEKHLLKVEALYQEIEQWRQHNYSPPISFSDSLFFVPMMEKQVSVTVSPHGLVLQCEFPMHSYACE